MNNLANGYWSTGQTDEAVRLWEQALDLQRTKLGPDHPDTLDTMHNLATGYRTVGRDDEAISSLEKTIELRQAKLGFDHPKTLSSMHSLAISYSAAGRIEEAIGLYEESFKLKQAKLGPEDPDTLSSMKRLVWCLSKIKPADKRLTSDLVDSLRTANDTTQDGEMLKTLAAAEYRLGNFDQAIADAHASIKLLTEQRTSPINYAILAMSHFELEQPKEANEFRETLTESMKLDEFKADPDYQAFASEVDALFE